MNGNSRIKGKEKVVDRCDEAFCESVIISIISQLGLLGTYVKSAYLR